MQNNPFNLPETREEFTQLALVYGDTHINRKGLFSHLCDEYNEDETNIAYDLLKWITRTVEQFPDLVEYEFNDNSRYSVFVAGVFVFLVVHSRIEMALEYLDEIANPQEKRRVNEYCQCALRLYGLLCEHCTNRGKFINAKVTITRDT